MAFGTAYLVTDPDEKERALVAMVDRFFPDRTASLRQSTAQEIKATSVIAMEIEEASAKITRQGRRRRRRGLRTADLCRAHSGAHGAGRARNPVRGCSTASSGRRRCSGYSEGRLLEDALRDAYFSGVPEGVRGKHLR